LTLREREKKRRSRTNHGKGLNARENATRSVVNRLGDRLSTLGSSNRLGGPELGRKDRRRSR